MLFRSRRVSTVDEIRRALLPDLITLADEIARRVAREPSATFAPATVTGYGMATGHADLHVDGDAPGIVTYAPSVCGPLTVGDRVLVAYWPTRGVAVVGMITRAGWTSYTPTWTATGGTPSLGNGSLNGWFRYIDNHTLAVRILLIIGSTTSLGTTTEWRFTLPNSHTLADSGAFTNAVSALALQGSALYPGVGTNPDTGTSKLGAYCNASGSSVGYAVPATWTTNHRLTIEGVVAIA